MPNTSPVSREQSHDITYTPEQLASECSTAEYYDCGNTDLTDSLDISEVNLDSLVDCKVSEPKNSRKFIKKRYAVCKKDRCGGFRCHRCGTSNTVAKHIEFIKMYHCDKCKLYICEKCDTEINGMRRTEMHTKHRDRVKEVDL